MTDYQWNDWKQRVGEIYDEMAAELDRAVRAAASEGRVDADAIVLLASASAHAAACEATCDGAQTLAVERGGGR